MTRIANSNALVIAFWPSLLEESTRVTFGLQFSGNATGSPTLRRQHEQQQIGAFAIVHRKYDLRKTKSLESDVELVPRPRQR
ncbi:MAG TPA: hypothetical protein VLI55_10955 [Bryobacteraceae bacterium]|nr:hypothetical protein [Bryobacteraceae bacterium]